MHAFRHWDERWLNEARELGRLRLSLASFYREQPHEAIKDDMELSVVGVAKEIHISDTDLPEHQVMLSALREHGMDIGNAQGVVINEFKSYTSTPHAYVLCLSLDHTPGKFDSLEDKKDTVTRVRNINVLYDALRRADKDGFLGEHGGVGEIIYDDREYQIVEQQRKIPSPMCKPERFKLNREVRLWYAAAKPNPPEHIVLQSEEIARQFKKWPSITCRKPSVGQERRQSADRIDSSVD
ncbi:hypothetical protein [Ensifer canadensis]|uniref:hypothetical protein n=1 Tax=Ensifer canadensis TaxID=555315 RepID=UPI0035E3C555